MPTKRKRCKVWLQTERVIDYGDGKRRVHKERVRCDGKIKPGTPFCREHFKTHRLIGVKCTGEAHSNPFIDNCWTCMPFWGEYPVAVTKDYVITPEEWEWHRGTWE